MHLFGLLPILIAALVVARNPRRNGLGIALAILIGDALLVRDEMLISSAIFATAVIAHEVRERRAHRVPIGVYARAFGIPLAIVLLLFG